MSVPDPGWFWPEASQRAHYMVEGRSLCGKWATFGSYPLDNEPITTPCAECLRRFAKLAGNSS